MTTGERVSGVLMRWSTTYDRCRWKPSRSLVYQIKGDFLFFLGRTFDDTFRYSWRSMDETKEEGRLETYRFEDEMKRNGIDSFGVFQFEIEGGVWTTAQWSRCRAAERTDSNALARTNNVRATHRTLRTRKTWNYYHHPPSIREQRINERGATFLYLSKLGLGNNWRQINRSIYFPSSFLKFV